MYRHVMFCYSRVQQPRFFCTGWQFISRTISMNTSSTFCRSFADASRKGQPQSWAKRVPSAVSTSLWLVRSHLLPTSRIGTRSVALTRIICSCIVRISWTNTQYSANHYTMILFKQLNKPLNISYSCSVYHYQAAVIHCVPKSDHIKQLLTTSTPCLDKKGATLFSTVTISFLGGFL